MSTQPAASPRATILVVDDTPANLSLMSSLLKGQYSVRLANNGSKGLELARLQPVPDLILLDIMMPGLSGYEVLKELKADGLTRHIPVIFLTAMGSSDDETLGLEMGAADYITKPITPAVVLARVRTQLENKGVADFLRDQAQFLEREVAQRTLELGALQDVTILAMASLAETRDSDTGNHIRRTQHYVRELALKVQEHPRFGYFLDDATIDLLFKSAPLHDIGKVGIPDRILLKPGRLTVEEFEIMKTHTTLGRDAILAAEKQMGRSMEFLRHAKDIACYHQEKWDGSGYPEGLAGEAIPISARIMAVADVYDALISRRVYKEGMPHDKAVDIIVQGRGNHFDPDLVDAFLAIQDTFRDIAARYADTDSDLQSKAAQLDRFKG